MGDGIKVARTLSPNRQDLALEAIQLREFGWTQQQIADTLKVPIQTINRWLLKMGNGTIDKVGKVYRNSHYAIADNSHNPITLYRCKYEDVGDGIASESIDLILTDPPYLVSSNDITRKNQNNLQRDFGVWDKAPQIDYQQSVQGWATLMAKHLKIGGSLYLFIGYRQSLMWGDALEANGLSYCGLLVWHRANPAPQIRQTRWCPAFDMILFYSKGSPKTFNWLDQNQMHSVLEGPICAGNERLQGHPTQKPRWLLQKLLQVSSLPGNTVLDPFAGSGSTAFAAMRLPGRHVVLIEPEPKYVGLIQSTAKEEFQCDVMLKKTVAENRV